MRKKILCVSTAVALLSAGLAAPASAAGPLDEFYHQTISWQPCAEPPPPDPEDAPDGISMDPWKGHWKEMDCAEVLVPLDYARPGNSKLRLTISRIKATDPAHRQGAVLLNPGGPGGSGLPMPLGLVKQHSKLGEQFDLIGFDPRGVERSTQLKCERITEPLPDFSRPSDEELVQFTDHARAREAACQRAGGSMRPYFNTANTARDMDVIRAALGEKQINYLGYSYGTYLGAVYGKLFPANLNRSVLDSSVHPQWLWREMSEQQAIAVRSNVDHWAQWVAERNGTFHLGTSGDQVVATVNALSAQLDKKPVPLTRDRPEGWPGFWPKTMDRSTLDLFVGQSSESRGVWDVLAEVIGELRQAATTGAAASGDSSTAIGLLTARRDIPELDPGVYDTVTCEADWPSDLNTYYDDMRVFREKYPFRDGNAGGAYSAAPTPCTFRSFTPPEKPVELAHENYPTGLVVQGDDDPATPYAGGPAMADVLGSALISVRDSGIHGQYGSNQCVTDRVDDYLINGVLPGSRTECPGAEARPPVPADQATGNHTEQRHAESSTTKAARAEAALGHRSVWQ
ncbi:alpha/beta fold hydrolase [Amycolatopsis ultiminotia]|uniref:Alpha/beta fold hydrolase n=1 Tax=Amycolatopsis ultiminotia TaxID=543629 RepID=A0ABP6W392_9PSEU